MVTIEPVSTFSNKPEKARWMVLKNGSPIAYIWQGISGWFGTDFWRVSAPYQFGDTQDVVIQRLIEAGGY